ncbi:hypothetical protein [Azonexus hydrophilus]|uniref:hypothetical protein n=1 Tax=Azonexus hydrophilus TaxID=418702 RepID=UPI00048E217D|nr:hypothetical protein [Azonexus hydrophilus]
MSKIEYAGAVFYWQAGFKEPLPIVITAHCDEYENLDKEGLMNMQGYADDADALWSLIQEVRETDHDFAEGDITREEMGLQYEQSNLFVTLITGSKFWLIDAKYSADNKPIEYELATYDTEEEFRQVLSDRGEPITWM